ncbi:hypothetical protein ANN_12804 [Periplaneta americana]|uniref:Uncharacterized protein n=1 Tax=Periplaneta americana TaxID=6978 RepID=A0ABQ8TI55_PERAM|nr:hypothetical protein ANN_12804 [Periplaneta americana]
MEISLQLIRNSSFRYCNEVETLAHVLGSCQHGELLRNSRYRNIRKVIAQVLRKTSFEVHEEVHCAASEGGGIRRADIVALHKTNSKGFILDSNVRLEMSQTQPSEVNKEKQIYEPTIPYFREKYQMERTWEVHGLMIEAMGTIPQLTVLCSLVWPYQKMPEQRLPKIIMEWIPPERRKKGRPKKTWMEGVLAAMDARLEPGQWMNREEWRLVSGRRRQLL